MKLLCYFVANMLRKKLFPLEIFLSFSEVYSLHTIATGVIIKGKQL